MFLRDLATAVSDLVLPTACAGCARPGPSLCRACCAGEPTRGDIDGLPVVAAAAYAAGLRAALVAYKERDRRDVTAALSRLLADAVRDVVAELDRPAVLIPIPSARAAARRRGGDHVLRLARHCGRLLDLPVCRAMTLNRAVRDGARLSAAERALNVQGAMTAAGPPRALGGARRLVAAVIVDDIVTTGATLREGCRALSAAGWPVCGAAVVARTPRRHPALAPGVSASGTCYLTGLPWG